MSDSSSWLSIEKGSKMSSPLISREFRNCLSFANIKEQKILQEMQTPRGSNSKIHSHQTIHKDYDKENRTNERLKTGNRIREKESAKSSNKIIMENFQIQNESLRGTIDALKEQVGALTNSCSIYKDKYLLAREEIGFKNTKIRALENQIQVFVEEIEAQKRKEKEYEGIAPKIEELEELQETMIFENEDMKKRESRLKKLLGEVLVIAGSGSGNQIAHEIKTIINSTLNEM